MRNVKILALVAVLVLFAIQLKAQTITGKIIDEKRQPVEFATVCLLSLPDSAFVCGTTSDENGNFTLSAEGKKYVLRISAINLETSYVACDKENMGTIVVKENSKQLDEVVIKRNRSLFKMEGDGIKANIQGSVLGKLGSLKDVLNQLPLLSFHNDEVNVLGKGTPLVYINQHLVTDNKELEQLKSSEIKDIQVILNPGSKYPSATNSVIRITTIRKQGDGWSVIAEWKGMQNKHFCQNDYLSLNYRTKGWDFFGYLYYRMSESEEQQTNQLNFNYQGLDIKSFNDSQQNQKTRHLVPRVGMNYSSNDNTLSAGAAYFYQNIDCPFKQNSRYQTQESDEENEFYSHYMKKDHGNYQNADAYLQKIFNSKWQLDYNMSFTRLNLTTDLSTTEEEDKNSIHVGSVTTRLSSMFAEKMVLTKNTPIGNLSFGEEYVYTSNKQQYHVSDEAVSSHLSSNETLVRQNSAAAFCELAKSWGRFNVNGGLRYEYISYQYELNGQKIENQSKKYSVLMPSLSLNYNHANWGATLSFRSTIDRPSYQQLRSSMAYDNRYLYEGGNPMLKNSHLYDFGLLIRYGDCVLSTNFIHSQDAIMFYLYPLEDAPVAVSSFTNVDYNSTNIMASYAPTIGRWKPSVTLRGYFQSLEYNGNRYNQPVFNYSFKNVITCPHSFMLTINFTGNSIGHNQMIKNSANFISSLMITKTFPFGLQTTLGVDDLFHTNREKWMMCTNRIQSEKWLKADSRVCYFTISYRLNSTKTKFKGTGAGNYEKSRL